MDDAKLREVLAALLDEMRQSKVQMSDVLAQRSEYAADIRELKASIDTTRRALDPEALGAHVADNIDEVMGQSVQKFAKGIKINFDAANANQNAADRAATAAQDIKDHTDKLNMERNALAAISRHLEERDQRSKWDWVTLGCGMVVAAALAGGGAVFFTKQRLDTANFADAIQLIQNDDDGVWCTKYATAQIIDGRDDTKFCAIHMQNYVEPEVSDSER